MAGKDDLKKAVQEGGRLSEELAGKVADRARGAAEGTHVGAEIKAGVTRFTGQEFNWGKDNAHLGAGAKKPQDLYGAGGALTAPSDQARAEAQAAGGIQNLRRQKMEEYERAHSGKGGVSGGTDVAGHGHSSTQPIPAKDAPAPGHGVKK